MQDSNSIPYDFVNSFDEPVLFLSSNFTVRALNISAEKIFATKSNFIIGQSFSIFCPNFDNNTQKLLSSSMTSYIGEKIITWRSISYTAPKDSIKFMLIGYREEQSNFLLQKNAISKKIDVSTYEDIKNLNQTLTGKTINHDKDTLEHVKDIYHYMENIIAEIPVSVYWMNKECIYLGCSNSMAKLLKLASRHDIIGKTYVDLYDEKSAECYKIADKKVMDTGVSLSAEEPLYASDGAKKTYLSNKAPLRDSSGEIIGMLGISVDITEQKNMEEGLKKAKETAEETLESLKKSQLEEQKQRTEAERLEIENTMHKSDLKIAQITVEKEQEMRKTVMMLVGDIVHDLRTPMATIDNATDILSSISPKLHELVKEAYELKSKALESINGAKLDYVINKMPTAQKEAINFMGQFISTTLHELSVAQKHPDEVVKPEELTKCSIRRVLENTMDGYPSHKNLVINQCFSYDFIFMGNSILMLKILFNLIKNADEQILANGKGEITITTKEAEDKNLLIIKDTAGGAPPDVVKNMFTAFFTTKKDGTGIGLAFCKKMMQNFGGDLTCHSVFGEYIEFTLSFPKTANTQPYNVQS